MAKAERQLLSGCYVISLRPVGAHAPMRRAAAAHGARVLALSPWRIESQAANATRRALRAALDADIVIATSPAAVRAATALRALRKRGGQAWCAVGAGTAAALRRAGIVTVASPARLDS
jgi:uroporphyrinogen-III synthase